MAEQIMKENRKEGHNDEEIQERGNEINCYFEPEQVSGKTGITVDENGFVQAVTYGGQAHAKGIKKGYRVMQVNKVRYSYDGLVEAERKQAKYEITFQVL